MSLLTAASSRRIGGAVLVVMVTCDDSLVLRAALDSLPEACSRADASLLLVANGCELSQSTLNLLGDAGEGEVRFLPQRLGYAAGNNLGLRHALEAGFRHVLLLNPDTIAHPESIRALRDCLDHDPSVAVVGSFQVDYNAGDWETPNTWMKQILRRLPADPDTEVLDTIYVQGAALMVRCDILRRVGLLEEGLGSFYEETDLCRRVRLAGARVGLVLASRVRHMGGGYWRRSWPANLRRDYYYFRNEILFHLSGPGPTTALLATAWGVFQSQWHRLRRRTDRTVMPLFLWPLVPLGVVAKMGCLSRMRRRNRLLRRRPP